MTYQTKDRQLDLEHPKQFVAFQQIIVWNDTKSYMTIYIQSIRDEKTLHTILKQKPYLYSQLAVIQICF